MYGENYVHTAQDKELIKRCTGFVKKSVEFSRNDYLRTLKYRKVEKLMPVMPDAVVEFEWPQDNTFIFEEEVLAKAFAELSLTRQSILTLSFVERMAPGEVAEKLNCSVKFVNNHKYLAIKQLRRILMEEGAL